MKEDKDKYVSKHYTWEQLIDLFPGTWVAVTDCVMDGPDILECTLLRVFDDDEVEFEMPKFIKEGIKCRRTTMGMEVGYIHGRFVEN